MRQQRWRADAARPESFLRIGQATYSVVPGATVVSMSVRHSAGMRSAMVRMRRFQRIHIGGAGAQIAQILFEIIALHVDDHAIGQGETLGIVSRNQRFFLLNATGDHRRHFRIFRFDRRFAPVQQGIFQ